MFFSARSHAEPQEAIHQQQRIRELQAEIAEREQQLHLLQQQLNQSKQQLADSQEYVASLAAFSGSLQDSQQSLSELSNNLISDEQTATAAQQLAASTNEATRKISDNLGALASQAKQAAEDIAKLDVRAQEVGGIVQIIRGIADQTNLLALNAAIEAARAGEHGRGFAVVADEVRNLSKRTASATTDIEKLVAFIRQESEQSRQQMTALADVAVDFSAQGQHTTTAMAQLASQSAQIEQNIARSALQGFCELAKVDHLTFKMQVYQVVLGLSATTTDHSDHRNCRLGQWYYQGEGQKRYASMTGYRELERPHQKLHEAAQQAITAYQQQQGSAVLTALTEMERASQEVVSVLERLSRSL